MPEARSTTIRFSNEVYRRLEASSVLTGLPINSIVVVACLEWLERHGPERLTAPLPQNIEAFQRIRPGFPTPAPRWLARRGRQAGGPQKFDLLSELARESMASAQRLAVERQHGYIGTEHLLEGLMSVAEGNAAKVLGALGVTSEALERRLAEVVRPEASGASSEMPQPTRRVKRVMEIAFELSTKQGSTYVGTEHLLLGILSEGEGVAASALRESGVDEAKVERELERLLVDEGAEEP
jgi:hypothetical protein